MSGPYSRSIAELEALVDKQFVQSESYDFLVNKNLFKMYQLYPDQAKTDFISKVFILALMKLPAADFLALSYLVGRSGNDPKVKQILKLAELLDTADFIGFWKEFDSLEETSLVRQTKGFEASIRHFILSSLQNVHRSISLPLLQAMLGFTSSSTEMDAFITANKAILQRQEGQDDVLFLLSSAMNAKKNTTFEESLRFEEVQYFIVIFRYLYRFLHSLIDHYF